MEGIERPVMKTLEEEKEAENRRDTERRRKEPTGPVSYTHLTLPTILRV